MTKNFYQPAPYFPQFSRIFAALFLLLLIIFSGPLPLFEKLKLAVLRDYQNPQAHLDLAKVWEESNNWENTQREVLLGLTFAPENRQLREELKKIEGDLGQPTAIRQDIKHWGQIAQDFPGYRDAYLQLATLYYQLYQTDRAKENLGKALELDPNFEPTRELEKILRY